MPPPSGRAAAVAAAPVGNLRVPARAAPRLTEVAAHVPEARQRDGERAGAARSGLSFGDVGQGGEQVVVLGVESREPRLSPRWSARARRVRRVPGSRPRASTCLATAALVEPRRGVLAHGLEHSVARPGSGPPGRTSDASTSRPIESSARPSSPSAKRRAFEREPADERGKPGKEFLVLGAAARSSSRSPA